MGKKSKTLSGRSAKQILGFLHVAEQLKNELRHSKTSCGRCESVAEHCWRMALMAVLLKAYLPQKLDWARMMAMILVHDLAEARTGDVPIFKTSLREQKKSAERKAMREFRTQLPKDIGPWIYELWEEFEAKKTAEAKIANALDKLEAQIQHNEADLKSWIEWEKIRVFGGLDTVTAVDQSIVQLKDAAIKEAILKLKKGGEDIASLRKKARGNKG